MDNIEVGLLVTKAQTFTSPGIFVGTVLHVDESDEGKPFAWLIGKRDQESPWGLIGVHANALEPWMGGDVPGGTAGIPEIGKALADRHRLMEEQAAARSKRLADLEREHEDFREQVRTMAIEKAAELNWCTPGLNEALRELGLAPKTRWFTVPVQVSQTVYVKVEAADEDDALDEADNLERREVLDWADEYDWEIKMPRSSQVEETDAP